MSLSLCYFHLKLPLHVSLSTSCPFLFLLLVFFCGSRQLAAVTSSVVVTKRRQNGYIIPRQARKRFGLELFRTDETFLIPTLLIILAIQLCKRVLSYYMCVTSTWWTRLVDKHTTNHKIQWVSVKVNKWFIVINEHRVGENRAWWLTGLSNKISPKTYKCGTTNEPSGITNN